MDTKISLLICFALLIVCFVTSFICQKLYSKAVGALICKTLASLMLVVGALYAYSTTGGAVANMMIVLGFIVALIGDILLEFVISPQDSRGLLSVQMASHSVMNALYFVALVLIFYPLKNFAIFASGAVVIGLIFAVVIQLLESKLRLNFGGFRIQVAIECFTGALVAVLALGICFFVQGMAIFAVGAILALGSQILGYFVNFSTPKRRNILLALEYALYYIGQLMIMAYMLFQIV